MKKISLLLIFAGTLSFAQVKEFPLRSEDFSEIILNKQANFEGITAKDSLLKLSFGNVVKNPEKPNVYLVSGQSETEGNKSDFLGEIIFSEKYDVKGNADQMLIFGDFYFIENKSGAHSGILKGKLRIQAHKNLNVTEKISTVTFKGTWKNHSGTSVVETWWANYIPSDIAKVVFK